MVFSGIYTWVTALKPHIGMQESFYSLRKMRNIQVKPKKWDIGMQAKA